MKEAAGDTPTAPPFNEDPGMPRYSLARLQVYSIVQYKWLLIIQSACTVHVVT